MDLQLQSSSLDLNRTNEPVGPLLSSLLWTIYTLCGTAHCSTQEAAEAAHLGVIWHLNGSGFLEFNIPGIIIGFAQLTNFIGLTRLIQSQIHLDSAAFRSVRAR